MYNRPPVLLFAVGFRFLSWSLFVGSFCLLSIAIIQEFFPKFPLQIGTPELETYLGYGFTGAIFAGIGGIACLIPRFFSSEIPVRRPLFLAIVLSVFAGSLWVYRNPDSFLQRHLQQLLQEPKYLETFYVALLLITNMNYLIICKRAAYWMQDTTIASRAGAAILMQWITGFAWTALLFLPKLYPEWFDMIPTLGELDGSRVAKLGILLILFLSQFLVSSVFGGTASMLFSCRYLKE